MFSNTPFTESRKTFSVLLLLLFISAIGLGVIICYEPWKVLLIYSIAFFTIITLFITKDFLIWQRLIFFTMTGYIVLSYGFANWTIHIGKIPIPVGHFLILTGFIPELIRNTDSLKKSVKEPIVISWFLLLGMSFVHLFLNIPRYGAYAIRDVSFVIEGIFLLLGFLLAQNANNVRVFLRILAIVFFINFIYALTFPFGNLIRSVSPVSGIFQQVPIFGAYTHTSLFLVAGAFFYILVGNQTLKWPSKIVSTLAILQFSWSFIFQTRSMYVAIILCVFILILNRGIRRTGLKAVFILVLGTLILFFLLSVSGIKIHGRLGEVGLNFLLDHFRSLLFIPDTPGAGTIIWRTNLLYEVWARWTVSVRNIIFGEGFGQPLIDFISYGVTVRQPHNTHITILMRLGLLGFALWCFIHWKIFSLFIRTLRDDRQNYLEHNLFLWLFLFYILSMLFTSVEPWLEFSFGAIPFFTIIGFTIGLSKHINQPNRQL